MPPEPSKSEFVVSLAVLASRHGNVPTRKSGDVPKNTSCHECAHARSHNFTHHILCASPDTEMVGSQHGVERGWFMYPFEFDPVWRLSECRNFKRVSTEGSAVSGAVSGAEQ